MTVAPAEHKVTVTDGMSAGEFIGRMYDAYGDGFNWQCAPYAESFAAELITEVGEDDPFVRGRKVTNEAKGDSCDDMLFCSADSSGSELWRIYHLTFSHCREKKGWPIMTELPSKKAALEYIRDTFIEEYL